MVTSPPGSGTLWISKLAAFVAVVLGILKISVVNVVSRSAASLLMMFRAITATK